MNLHPYIYRYIWTYSAHIYIYIYIRINTYEHTHTYTYIYMHTHTYIWTYAHDSQENTRQTFWALQHDHMHTYTHTHIHTYEHTPTTCRRTYGRHFWRYKMTIHIHTHTYTYVDININAPLAGGHTADVFGATRWPQWLGASFCGWIAQTSQRPRHLYEFARGPWPCFGCWRHGHWCLCVEYVWQCICVMLRCKVWCSVLQCVAVFCSVLQCVAVCYSVVSWATSMSEWVMSHTKTSHVTQINDSCHAHKWLISHT